jgi:hypothetical protein
MGPPFLKRTYNLYKDLELDYISFLNMFLGILNILKIDKSPNIKIL